MTIVCVGVIYGVLDAKIKKLWPILFSNSVALNFSDKEIVLK